MTTMDSLIAKRLAELKSQRIAPVAAIKAMQTEFGLSLAAAKKAISASPAWAVEVANGAELHEEILRVLSGSSGE